MQFIPVRSFDNYVEAHIVMGYLQEHNINCWLKDEYTVTIDPMLSNAIGGIKLMVTDAQVSRALDLLEQLIKKSSKTLKCPYCGSLNIQVAIIRQEDRNWLNRFISWLTGNKALTETQSWQCAECGKAFLRPAEEISEAVVKAG